MYEQALHVVARDHKAKRRMVVLELSLDLWQKEEEQLTGSHDRFVFTLRWVVAVSNVFDGEIIGV